MMKMKVFVALILICATLQLGDCIKCFSCQDYTGTCSKTRDCSQDDACLTLKARGGDTYRSCMKYSECDFTRLSFMYPQIKNFKFDCCNSDLCNSAPLASASVVIGLLCSLLTVWWTSMWSPAHTRVMPLPSAALMFWGHEGFGNSRLDQFILLWLQWHVSSSRWLHMKRMIMFRMKTNPFNTALQTVSHIEKVREWCDRWMGQSQVWKAPNIFFSIQFSIDEAKTAEQQMKHFINYSSVFYSETHISKSLTLSFDIPSKVKEIIKIRDTWHF